ncbi:MAG: LptF/LptG family permease [Bacteroidota bacterium]|jgi:lipopolysaccharide export system permease protein
MLKKLDLYILKKFVGTFFFSIGLVTILLIVFDISEKLDNFFEHQVPLKEIIFDHYLNFVPFFINMLSPLFIFISVILFTSRMAARSETVAILSSGVSYTRFLRPYMVGAGIFCLMNLYLGHFVIPNGNKVMQDFEDKYVNSGFNNEDINIHRNFTPEYKMYLANYNNTENKGNLFSMEKYKGNKLIYFFSTPAIRWDSVKKVWRTENWFERHVRKSKDSIAFGTPKDLKIDFTPDDMGRKESKENIMTYFELKEFMEKERKKGTPGLERFEVVNYKRTSVPFASFILTLIGVVIAARKIRGGIGMHIAIGLLIGATYVVFLHFSSIFAVNGILSPIIAVWLPNFIYLILAIILLRTYAQK